MFHSTGRFVMGIIAVGLVLLISVQIMMEFDQTRSYLKWVEGRLGIIDLPEVREVSSYIPEETVTIKMLNSGEYSDARVLMNNERDYHFQTKIVQIPVTDGDLLIIDTRGIDEALWFEIIAFSETITSLKQNQQFRVRNDLQVIEIKIDYKDRY